MNNAIIVCSGGLDSVTTAYYVKKKLKINKIKIIFFDYGQRTLKEEEYCVKKCANDLNAEFEKVEVKWLGEISTALLNKKEEIPETTKKDLGDIEKENKEKIMWWVPCRNSIFLINALAFAESLFISKNERWDVYIGVKKEGKIPMKDTRPEFIKSVNDLAEQGTYHGGYKIIAPLIDLDKDEIVKLASELKVPLEFTYSCYSGGGFKGKILKHCGTCANCMDRKMGFYWAGVKDISIYEKD